MPKVIAIDGPAASGKSTLSKLLAKRLGFYHVDSGALYRTFTLALIRLLDSKIPIEELVEETLPESLKCNFYFTDNGTQINTINDMDVNNELRKPDVTASIKFIADNKKFRVAINTMLQNLAQEQDLVVDGRDMTSLVFPRSPFKFYISAELKVRVQRRLLELKKMGHDLEFKGLEKELKQRDFDDKNRGYGALLKVPDAIEIDNSDSNPDLAVTIMERYILSKN